MLARLATDAAKLGIFLAIAVKPRLRSMASPDWWLLLVFSPMALLLLQWLRRRSPFSQPRAFARSPRLANESAQLTFLATKL